MAPAPVKRYLGNVIGLYVHLRADLVKAKWSLAALEASPKTVGALLAEADKDKRSFTRPQAVLHQDVSLLNVEG